MKQALYWICRSFSLAARIIGATARGIIALVVIGGTVAALANYTMTQGAGTTFGSIVVGAVHYVQMLTCDPTTPSQCAAVDASGNISVKDSTAVGTPGAADAANDIVIGGRAGNAEQAATTNGNNVKGFFDLVGKWITSPYANRENYLNCAVTDAVNTATTCTGMGAQGVGVKIYITNLCITRSDAGTTAASATLNDTATTIYDVPNNGGGGGICPPLPVPLQVAANTAFTVTMSSAITSVHISASGYKGY